MSDSVNIIIGGEAGQGLVTVGQILAKSLVRAGYSIVVNQGYHSRIRGGHNTYMISASTTDISAPPPEPYGADYDILVALDETTNAQTSQNLRHYDQDRYGLLIADSTFPDTGWPNVLRAPYKELGSEKYDNTAALGIVAAVLGLDEAQVSEVVNDFFGRHPEAIEENRKALSASYAWGKEQIAGGTAKPADGPLSPAPSHGPRLVMQGNEAIALGALSAGAKFCAFYPMTPATSIALTLAANAKTMGMIVEQAEDEIAAINMALGASYAGAPSMVATSGGGFALMVEGVSLAGMIETPIVIVVGQRPGPATGMPTRTEQADLEFVLHAGHGEFPRAILAPGTVEECFHLTRKAFELAERYQGPVFILTDQFLSDSYRAIEPFDIDALEPVRPGAEPDMVQEAYLRYRFTESGVSPRLIPGASKHLVIADSDEHTEDGHLTEDEVDHISVVVNSKGEKEHLSIRRKMVEKRLRKLDGMKGETIAPEYLGDASPDLLLVSWGSTKGAVEETVKMLRETGRSAAVLHFSQVWPLAPDQFAGYLKSAKRVVSVEGNATGQLARVIRGETGFDFDRMVLRFDGLPMTPRYIIEELSK